MTTCVVTLDDFDDAFEKHFPDAYACVGPAGELTIYPNAGSETQVAQPLAIYAAGSWLKVSYE